MADKRLRKLTIDGTTMEIPNQVILYKSNHTSKPFPSGWATERGASITLDEPGVYLIYGGANFSSSTQTGETTHRIMLWESGVSYAEVISSSVDAMPYATEKPFCTFFVVYPNESIEIYITYQCARPLQGNVETNIKALRILSEFDT